MATVELDLVHGKYGFECKDEDKHVVRMDSKPELGGENFGTRPMLLLLEALAGCSSVDVISILSKQKQEIKGFHVTVNGSRGKQGDLSKWENIEINFRFTGGNVDLEKAKKAVNLSLEKYCSVAATLVDAGAKITPTVEIK